MAKAKEERSAARLFKEYSAEAYARYLSGVRSLPDTPDRPARVEELRESFHREIDLARLAVAGMLSEAQQAEWDRIRGGRDGIAH